MDDRDMAEFAAVSAIMQYLLAARAPKHDDASDPAWRAVFEDAHFLAQRYGGVYLRNKRE